MSNLKYIYKPYDTKRYEKYLKFFKMPFVEKILNTFKYAVMGLIISLSFSLLVFLFDFLTYFFNFIAGSDASVLSFGSYLLINTFIPLLIWIYGFFSKNRRSKKFVNNSLEKQKYLINRLTDLYNNRLKLLEYLGNNTTKGLISDEETAHIKNVLEKILPKIEEMKKNVEIHKKNKDFLSKFSMQKDSLYSIIDELKVLDDRISSESRDQIDKYIDDAYIFEAFDNIEKDMKKLDIDSIEPGLQNEKS